MNISTHKAGTTFTSRAKKKVTIQRIRKKHRVSWKRNCSEHLSRLTVHHRC